MNRLLQNVAPGDAPCLYDVSIRHVRQAPVHHDFRHASYMWKFDLGAPPDLPVPLRPLARYRKADHVDIEAELGRAGIAAERIVVLTNLAVLGYVFNPISIYWCYGQAGQLVAHVAEVHNTYGERHAYVLPGASQTVAKAMRVSPFNSTDGTYRVRVSPPGEQISVSVVLVRPGDRPFRATLLGRRLEATPGRVARCAARYPAAPLRGRARIQLEGLRLWRRGLGVHPR